MRIRPFLRAALLVPIATAAMLANAPEPDDERFRVPRILED